MSFKIVKNCIPAFYPRLAYVAAGPRMSQGHMCSFSDRRVSYAPHDWPNSYVCMTVERSDESKFTEGSWQGSLTVNNERAVLASKQSRKS